MRSPTRHIAAGAAALALLIPASAGADTGILAIGDFGVGGAAERRMGAAMEQFAAGAQADALVTLGDNDYTESPAAFRRNWLDSFGWAAENGLVVAGTLGNHDVLVDGGRYQHELLGIRGHFYRRAVGEVALFQGTADLGEKDGGVFDWIGRANDEEFVGFFTSRGYTGHFRLARRP